MQVLRSLRLAGFRTIRDMGEALEFRPVNVLIGANGTGKSNLIDFFSLLNYLMSDRLSDWLDRHGGSADQFYYGPRQTQEIQAELTWEDEERTSTYRCRLRYTTPDGLRIAEETLSYHRAGYDEPWQIQVPGDGAGSGLSRLVKPTEIATAKALRTLLQRTQVFHFHDTSHHARVMQSWLLNDNRYLKWDGGNLAPVLYRLREEKPAYYQRLLGVIRMVVPFFGDFVLEPVGQPPAQRLLLQWRERGSDLVFGPHQLSDGTLRFIQLATLLLLPEEPRPRVVIIHEPELGLHPVAIETLGSLVYTVSDWTQVILSTQSPALLDVFDAEDIVVVSRVPEDRAAPTIGPTRYETRFQRLDPDQLVHWEDYSLSELWEKNVIAGGPTV